MINSFEQMTNWRQIILVTRTFWSGVEKITPKQLDWSKNVVSSNHVNQSHPCMTTKYVFRLFIHHMSSTWLLKKPHWFSRRLRLFQLFSSSWLFFMLNSLSSLFLLDLHGHCGDYIPAGLLAGRNKEVTRWAHLRNVKLSRLWCFLRSEYFFKPNTETK